MKLRLPAQFIFREGHLIGRFKISSSTLLSVCDFRQFSFLDKHFGIAMMHRAVIYAALVGVVLFSCALEVSGAGRNRNGRKRSNNRRTAASPSQSTGSDAIQVQSTPGRPQIPLKAETELPHSKGVPGEILPLIAPHSSPMATFFHPYVPLSYTCLPQSGSHL